jgi:type IV pilus assembly protein PilC
MPSFRCLFAGGKELRVEAESVPAAIAAVQQPSDAVVAISEESVRQVCPRVTELELATFYRQLSSMLQAGVPVAEGLQILARDTANKELKQVCYDLYQSMSAGEAFTTGLRRFPDLFTPLQIALARAGEFAGLLPQTLAQLADYLERSGKLNRRFSSALVYPAVVGTIVIGLLVSYWGAGLIVKMMEIFQEMGISNHLPPVTRLIITISKMLLPTLLLTIITVIIIVVLIKAYYRTTRGRISLDRTKLRLPFIGQIAHKNALARFCRTLALVLDNGVTISNSLALAGEASGNAIVARGAKTAIGYVEDGATLSQALGISGIFPAQVCDQVATGENSGTLLLMLNSLADYFEAQTDHLARAFSAVIEPLLIIILGVAVGLSIVGLFLPLISAIQAMTSGDAGM